LITLLGLTRPFQPNVGQVRIMHADMVFELSKQRIAGGRRIGECPPFVPGPTHAPIMLRLFGPHLTRPEPGPQSDVPPATHRAFMGGVVRSIDQGARFEVHMFATGEEVTREVRRDVDDPPRSIAAFNDRFPDAQLDPAGVEEYVTQHNTSLAAFLRDQAVSEDIKSIQQNAAATSAKIGQFLLRMQLSLDFLTAFASIPNDFPRPLSAAELRRFNVVND
jgi:hypothetical protein